jgi:hypothetical protein
MSSWCAFLDPIQALPFIMLERMNDYNKGLTNSLIDARAQQLPNDKRKYFMLLN